MNGIEKITQRIAADAETQAQAILAQARIEAESAAREAREGAQAEREAILDAGRRQAAQREERLESMAGLEGRKLLLAEKGRVLEETFRLALTRLEGLDPAAYTDLLAGLMVRGSSTGRETVLLNERDRTGVGAQAVAKANETLGDGRLTLSGESRPIRGGCVLADGPVEVDCSLETLVELQKEEQMGRVAQLLFDQAP